MRSGCSSGHSRDDLLVIKWSSESARQKGMPPQAIIFLMKQNPLILGYYVRPLYCVFDFIIRKILYEHLQGHDESDRMSRGHVLLFN